MGKVSIKTDGFVIVSKGDPSVGIFSAEWQLLNGFVFETQEELEEFRENIRTAFEMIADDCSVITIEERRLQIEQDVENSNN